MTPERRNALFAILASAALGLGAASVVQCSSCTPAQQQKIQTVETKLCKARAAYKLAAIAAGGALDPKPGSARAELERDEDAFCLARADAGN